MVTYDFYKDIYLGSALSPAAFPRMIARAEDYISRLERTCTVDESGPDSRAMALCAVAEAMEQFARHRFISQQTVGGVSVRYEKSDGALERLLRQTAGTYLDIRRGVS